MKKAKFSLPNKEVFPTFELAHNPTISIPELKQRMKDGTMGGLKITDTVTGKTVTLDGMFDSVSKVFDKHKIPQKKRDNFWRNVSGKP